MTLAVGAVIFGSAINFLGTLVYIRDTIRGRTKPNRVTWLMWSVAPLIGTAAALSSGVTWAALPVFMTGFCPILVLVASFWNPHAYWKLHTFDYACGALSALALVLWYLTRDPIVAIALAIASDALASVPTLVKAWRYPETETAYAYTASGVSALSSFFAISHWTFAAYAFPAYLVAMNTLITFGIVHGRSRVSR